MTQKRGVKIVGGNVLKNVVKEHSVISVLELFLALTELCV